MKTTARRKAVKPAPQVKPADVVALRKRSLEAQVMHGTMLLAEPYLYRLISNFLLVSYRTSGHSVRESGAEFFAVLLHLLDGGGIETAPIQLLHKASVVEAVQALTLGESVHLGDV